MSTETDAFPAFDVTGLSELHIGRATMKPGNAVSPIFHYINNHGLTTPESFVAICNDITKLALSTRASASNEDDNVISDVLMKSIAMGSTNAQISRGTITHTNRQFGVFFLPNRHHTQRSMHLDLSLPIASRYGTQMDHPFLAWFCQN